MSNGGRRGPSSSATNPSPELSESGCTADGWLPSQLMRHLARSPAHRLRLPLLAAQHRHTTAALQPGSECAGRTEVVARAGATRHATAGALVEAMRTRRLPSTVVFTSPSLPVVEKEEASQSVRDFEWWGVERRRATSPRNMIALACSRARCLPRGAHCAVNWAQLALGDRVISLVVCANQNGSAHGHGNCPC